jgi:twinkle protein
MIGFERNTQAEDAFVKTVTTLRVVKDRYTGQATGSTILLGYDSDRGLQYELSAEEIAKYHGDSTDAVSYGGEF